MAGAADHARILATVQRAEGISLAEAKIARSWMRCVNTYGIDPENAHKTPVLEHTHIRERQGRLDEILEIARIEISDLYRQIVGSEFALIFTDSEGVIVDWLSDSLLTNPFRKAGLWLGAIWNEENEGTNAIGTCLVERQPLTVHRDEHFRSCHTKLTCSAAPVFDPQGQLLAVLDISSVSSQDSKQSQFHTLTLAALSARLIENCYFLKVFHDQWILRLHQRPECVGLSSEGILALDDTGRILAVNQCALNQLGQERSQLIGERIDAVFDINLDRLLGSGSRQLRILWELHNQEDRRFFAMLYKIKHRRSLGNSSPALVESTPLPLTTTLEGLKGEDPLMAYNVRCAKRVLNKQVNILLMGETGTGKEAFAKAIHEASERADKPFVAVNCASIPENLIESELFGYKHGAFTGARREGMRGKILQANGGTLFLDEIGDMPLALQTRLLRVLEEKEVLPLGSELPVAIDLHVISATHRNLQERIAIGEFREDLYYRLNGLMLTLPTLRERVDRTLLIRGLLAAESEGMSIGIDEEAFKALDAYSWPGNIRQLRNVLRTAVALCEDSVIRLEDLPSEIALISPQHLAQRTCTSATIADASSVLVCAEKEALLRELDRNRWNITSTSAHLGISRNTLYRKMRKHGIKGTENNQGTRK